MATTEMDCSSPESKSEQGSLDPDSKYPLKVLYCGGISMHLLNLFRNFFTGHVQNVIEVLLCLCSVLFAHRGKPSSVTNCDVALGAKLDIAIAVEGIAESTSFVCSIVSTCPSQQNVGCGLRKTFLTFLQSWL